MNDLARGHGLAPQGQAHYNASKAAVPHLTKSLAADWAARGVRVNAVAPTYIATPLIAFMRHATEPKTKRCDQT